MLLDNVKKIGIIIVIAILFSLFSFSIVDMVMEEPDYSDFCAEKPYPVRPLGKETACESFNEATKAQIDDCNDRDGNIEYSYDASGCPTSFECNTCRGVYEAAGKDYRLIGFIITTIIGIAAIIVGMYVKSENEVVGWVFSGLLIGGIASVFIGTMMYFRDMGRFVKPFVLLAEIALIIWVAVKTAMGKKKE